MRKLFTLITGIFLLNVAINGQVFITELADPDNNTNGRYIELYNAGATAVDFTEGSNWRIDKYTNASATVSQTLDLTGSIPAGGFYIIATGPVDGDFFTLYSVNADQFDGANDNVAGSNGDDNLELYDGAGTLVDQFGVPGEDGTGTNHEFEDGRAERIATVTSSNPTWDVSEWIIDSDQPSGDGAQNAPDSFDPGAWIGAGGSSVDPEPTNHVTGFTATENGYSQVDLTWTENDGSQIPSGYLIKSSTVSYAAITAPIDGDAEPSDDDMSDGSGVINVAHGSSSYSWTGPTGLDGSTTYYYKIYPYTNSGSDIDYKTDGTVPQDDATTDPAPVLPNLVINEILADPDATLGDANGDGTVNTSADEFVEIVNLDGSSVDISGYTIEDGFGIRHTFAASTIIPNGQSVVVFGGGTPTGIPGTVFTADDGQLGLNNTGDIIIFKDNLGNTIATYTYGSEGGDNQSLAREPDYLGPFVKHSTIVTNPVLFSPGKENIGGTDLPVELTSFSATVSNKAIKLIWNTATELNNYGFEIQRSVEKGKWENIGFVNGNGTSNSPKDYSFVDNKLSNSRSYIYRLKQVDNDGSYEFSKTIEVVLGAPIAYKLHQNYPNPFNPSTLISFTLPEDGFTRLTVFNSLGQEIKSLVNENLEAGYHQFNFNAVNLTSGVYYYKLEAGNFVQINKMMLLK